MMHRILLFIMASGSLGVLPLQSLRAETLEKKTCLQEACVSFRIADRWVLADRQTDFTSRKMDHYKTGPMKSPSAGDTIPAISITFLHFDRRVDPLEFNIMVRSRLPQRDLDGSIALQKISEHENGAVYKFIGFHGFFTSGKIRFRQSFATAVEGQTGVVVSVTAPADVIPELQGDIDAFFESVLISPNRPTTTYDSEAARMAEAERLYQVFQKRTAERDPTLLEPLLQSCDLGFQQACYMNRMLVAVTYGFPMPQQ